MSSVGREVVKMLWVEVLGVDESWDLVIKFCGDERRSWDYGMKMQLFFFFSK